MAMGKENVRVLIPQEDLERRVAEMAEEITRLARGQRRELVPVPRSTALVVWQPKNRRS